MFGFDEAGRGPLAGPLTVSVVSFHKSTLTRISNGHSLLGINDSKVVKESLRHSLFLEIKSIAQFFSIIHISPRFIDDFNINQAIFYGILKALNKIRVKDPFIIMDGNYNWKNCTIPCNPPRSISIPKADSHIISVQAASILAKVSRDQLMKKYNHKYPAYGFDKHKGYGTKTHIDAIQKYGPCPIHRKSFIRRFI